MATFEYDGNLACLAYENPNGFVELLKPFRGVPVESVEDLRVFTEIEERLKTDRYLLRAGILGTNDRHVLALDALLASELPNEEAIDIALFFGADPADSMAGLVKQVHNANWEVLKMVISAGITLYPLDGGIFAEFAGTENARILEELLSFWIAALGFQSLGDLLAQNNVTAVCNRLRRYSVTLEDVFEGGVYGCNLLLVAKWAALEHPMLIMEICLRLGIDVEHSHLLIQAHGEETAKGRSLL